MTINIYISQIFTPPWKNIGQFISLTHYLWDVGENSLSRLSHSLLILFMLSEIFCQKRCFCQEQPLTLKDGLLLKVLQKILTHGGRGTSLCPLTDVFWNGLQTFPLFDTVQWNCVSAFYFYAAAKLASQEKRDNFLSAAPNKLSWSRFLLSSPPAPAWYLQQQCAQNAKCFPSASQTD